MDQPRGHAIYQSNEECAAEKDPKSSRRLVAAVPCRAGLVVGNGITELGSLITKTMRGSGTHRSQQQGGHKYYNEWQDWRGSQGPLTSRELRG